MRTLILSCMIASIASLSCKKEKSEESEAKALYDADLLQKKHDFDNAGQCTILDLVVAGELDVTRISDFARSATQRVSQSEILWTAVAKARAERGSAMGGDGKEDGWINRLQTRGYIEPVYLANIQSGIQFNGNNAMDVFQDLATKTKDEAVRFGRTIFSGNQQSIKIDEAFRLAFQQSGRDPFKAMGYIGALTIWDRWNAEQMTSKNKGSRNEYTVLPQLMSSIGQGDKTGQIYHFWGFVALIAANGPYMGSFLGNSTTLGYEVVRSKLADGYVDVEDFEIDNSAISYALGMHKILAQKPSKEAANEIQKKLMCKSKISQTTDSVNDDGRKCEIWLEYSDSMQQATSMIGALESEKPMKVIGFNDIMSCAIAAKQAVGDYKFLEVKTKSGKSPNFSFMRYGGSSKNKKVAIFSSAWIANGLDKVRPPSFVSEYCVQANKIGGDCNALKQVVSTSVCPKAAEFQKCTKENADEIEFYRTVFDFCLSSRPQSCTNKDQRYSSDCWHANKSGGTCGNLRQSCSGRYCKLSAENFRECTKNHKLQIDTCMASNQHCLNTELDRCIPLKDLSKYSFEVIW